MQCFQFIDFLVYKNYWIESLNSVRPTAEAGKALWHFLVWNKWSQEKYLKHNFNIIFSSCMYINFWSSKIFKNKIKIAQIIETLYNSWMYVRLFSLYNIFPYIYVCVKFSNAACNNANIIMWSKIRIVNF